MAQLLNLGWFRAWPGQDLPPSPLTCRLSATSSYQKANSRTFPSLHPQLNSNGRYMCLFSYNRKQDEAQKALESALGEDKNEGEKWDKETKKRVEVGGRSDVGGGGWFGSGGGGFGSGGSDGWSNGDSFWSGAQQTSFAVLGLIIMYLIVAKGDVIVAAVLSQLEFALRGPRKGLSFIASKIFGKSPRRRIRPDSGDMTKKNAFKGVSAKERVVAKWGSE